MNITLAGLSWTASISAANLGPFGSQEMSGNTK
ncbi:Uncharacterised protein [Mycobacterium tuberculosis]|nr:Uncharacterised protein [Mycobacterium tuberculosis]